MTVRHVDIASDPTPAAAPSVWSSQEQGVEFTVVERVFKI